MCEQLAQGCYPKARGRESNPRPTVSQVQRPNHYTNKPHIKASPGTTNSPPQVRSCGMDGEACLSQFSNFVLQVNCIHGAYAQLPHEKDPWDASPPTLEITGTKCVWSPSTFATIFVTFRSAPWEAIFKGETERKVGK